MMIRRCRPRGLVGTSFAGLLLLSLGYPVKELRATVPCPACGLSTCCPPGKCCDGSCVFGLTAEACAYPDPPCYCPTIECEVGAAPDICVAFDCRCPNCPPQACAGPRCLESLPDRGSPGKNVCMRPENPEGSGTHGTQWTGDQWAYYLQIRLDIIDYDDCPVGCPPTFDTQWCTGAGVPHASCPVVWSGHVDYTVPGTYVLTATPTNYDACENMARWAVDTYTGPQLKYIVKVLEADLRFAGLSQELEDIPPGGLVPLNDDLRGLTLGGNWEPIEAANATWCLYSNGSGGIRVWRDQARSQEIISGFEYPWSDHPTSLWVEGILPGQVIVTLVNRDLHSRGATCDDDLYLTVVDVAAVKWQNPVTQAWMTMPGTLNIFKDTPVTFKAFPDPQDVEFPAGKPEWSGTSGASGSGETTTVTFGTQSQTCQDYKTLTVSCSSIPPDPPLTYNTIVYDLRKNFVPADNFAGRSYDQYGLGEDVTLGVIPDPAPCGGDPGAWFSLGYPTSVWAPPAIVCAAVPCSHTFKYKITSGPSIERGPQFTIGVLPPSNAWLMRDGSGNCPAVGEWRGHNGGGSASAAFQGLYFLEPRNVSFVKLDFREGSGPADQSVGTGHFAPQNGNYSHPVQPWTRVWSGAGTATVFGPNSGCFSGFVDRSGLTLTPAPLGNSGFWTYPIPLEYRVGAAGSPVEFDNAQSEKVLGATGTVNVYKKGLSETRAVSDPVCPF